MNVTHSVDAYVLRSVIRRASFDVQKVTAVSELIEAELTLRGFGEHSEGTMTDELQTMLDIYKFSNMHDISIIDCLTHETIACVPNEYLLWLSRCTQEMIARGSSPVVTVHDSYGALPSHCNTVRYHYKEVMAELAESTILEFIVSQIVGQKVTYIKKSNNLGDLIRNSNYGIC